MITHLESVLHRNRENFHPVLPFDVAKDKLFWMDFTEANVALSNIDITDLKKASKYLDEKLKETNARYAIGGYNENRAIHRKNNLVNTNELPIIHLGIDIWGEAGTPVYSPIGGMVYSSVYNDKPGDYGPTIILLHQIDTTVFYTLYAHLSIQDVTGLQEGNYVTRGQQIGTFGTSVENGNWPPHLHFQIIEDMELKTGTYPGFATLAEREKYLRNCPNPDLILGMMQYLD